MAPARPRASLRKQWQAALGTLSVLLVVTMTGTFAAMLQVVGHYRSVATELDRTIELSSTLTTQIATHEALAHQLWNGTAGDTTLYQQQQEQIVRGIERALQATHSSAQRELLNVAYQTWQEVLRSRGLWAPGAKARPGVTLEMQQEFGAASDAVAVTFSQLTKRAIADGAHDLAAARLLQGVVIGLLVTLFALVLAVAVYIGRRLTRDVVKPSELLHEGVVRLRAGDFSQQVELPAGGRTNELTELASAFNSMANTLGESQRLLNHRADHDALTGLANRSSFQRRLESYLRPDNRRAGCIAIMFIDLDNFKVVNDTMGHAAGDALLRRVADRLSTCVRDSDLLARLGGDEFAILVVDHEEGRTPAVMIAERTLETVGAPMAIAGQQVTVSMSIGIAVQTATAIGPEELVAQADFAMYIAKSQGKGRFQVFDRELHQQAMSHSRPDGGTLP